MSTTLIDHIRRLDDALEGEAARVRWGRGLSYFEERVSSAGRLDISSIIAPDILEFLSDRYGLKRDGQSQPSGLRDAVGALEEECRRIVRDEPVHCFTWGIVQGGVSPQIGALKEFIDRAKAEEPADGAVFGINLVLEIAGQITQPDWSGVQLTRTSVEHRRVLADVAAPRDIGGSQLVKFLLDAMQVSVEGAERSIKRRRLNWSTKPHHATIEKLRPNFGATT